MRRPAIDMTGISRIDQPARRGEERHHSATACWVVRLFWTGSRPLVHETFADTAYGGRDGALQAAIEFRDRALEAEDRKTHRPTPQQTRTTRAEKPYFGDFGAFLYEDHPKRGRS